MLEWRCKLSHEYNWTYSTRGTFRVDLLTRKAVFAEKFNTSEFEIVRRENGTGFLEPFSILECKHSQVCIVSICRQILVAEMVLELSRPTWQARRKLTAHVLFSSCKIKLLFFLELNRWELTKNVYNDVNDKLTRNLPYLSTGRTWYLSSLNPLSFK